MSRLTAFAKSQRGSLHGHEQIGRRNWRLAVVELGKAYLGIGVDEGLLVDASNTLQVADIERSRPISLWGPISLCPKPTPQRRDVGDFRRAPRTPARTRGDQRERPAGVCPSDRLRSSITARRYFRILSARACMVASGSPASNSVIIITRCRCGAALPWSSVLAGMASLRPDWLSGSAQG
jgi:hypothetical protein